MSTHQSDVFEVVNWADYSEISITYQVACCDAGRTCKILRVCFSGEYGTGSGGNGDAKYMDAMYRAAVQVIDPDGLILDFSALHYDWGDRIGLLFNLPESWPERSKQPFAVVLGQGCEQGLRSLLTRDLFWSESDLSCVFDDISDARHYTESIVRELSIAAFG